MIESDMMVAPLYDAGALPIFAALFKHHTESLGYLKFEEQVQPSCGRSHSSIGSADHAEIRR
ncbi:hypothetical protein [Aquisediminimonas sediminicola]|uniref:hypothetical protein n=1 Tax=Alteraquisediminimonas sediminicola TaxID=2676787 RepID=UPI001C8EC2D4|nr:hypothetical protein [Aquisediminimonas sediminicola]